VLFLGPLWGTAAVALVRGRLDPRRVLPVLAVAAAGLLAVLGSMLWGGFDWFDGLHATREQYLLGVSLDRPGRYFVVANLVVLAVADLSGFSKGEVERIWLPFVPFLVLATAWLPTGAWSRRAWLGGQLGVALAVQVALRSHW
jgi:hypothetical protein